MDVGELGKKIGLGPEEVRETRVLNRVIRRRSKDGNMRRIRDMGSWWYVEWGWKEPRG